MRDCPADRARCVVPKNSALCSSAEKRGGDGLEKLSYTSSNEACSPATGKSLANIARAAPKQSMQCRTTGLRLSSVQS